MLDIFVCEDGAAQRRTVVKTIQNTVLIEELDMQLTLDTGDPYVLLEKVKTSQNTRIYFLDIDLSSNMNGMKLAQQILLKIVKDLCLAVRQLQCKLQFYDCPSAAFFCVD